MSHVRRFAFLALFALGCTGAELLAMGCTGEDFQPLTASDADAAGVDVHVDVDASDADAADDVDDASDGDSSPDAGPKSYFVSTLAGTGAPSAVDSPDPLQATFASPNGIAIGQDGSLYVTDNMKIRKIAVDGTVSTYAGTGALGLTNGSCTSATFSYPFGIVVEAADNIIYMTDFGNDIRKIYPTPCQVITLAGAVNPGASDGTGTAAMFNNPAGLTLDASGNVYVADSGNNKIRKVTPAGVVTTIAGTGAEGNADGPALNATFSYPCGIAVDEEGTLYVSEAGNSDIRKIANGQVTTLAGSGAQELVDGTGTNAAFYNPVGITINANGNLLVADNGNSAIRQVTPNGVVTTIAGNTGMQGAADGPANTATFYAPYDVAVDSSGVIYVADRLNNKIRKITPEN
ncbi:MAG: NHL repeat-containing protein [Polyangiaceae bacterium]|nr:NHL repeat-containing protein [Polyangiaceae bacterium]